jgi:hypothetical protein
MHSLHAYHCRDRKPFVQGPRALTYLTWQRVGGVAATSMSGKDAEIQKRQNSGEYHDSNEVDKTTMEGQVTKVGERISWTTEHVVERGELTDDATAESDVTEQVWQAEYIEAFGVPPPMEKLYDDETQAQMGWYDGEIDRDAELLKVEILEQLHGNFMYWTY